MAKVWILVGRDNHGKLISLFSPDLKKDFFPHFREKYNEENVDYRAYLRRKLSNSRKLINNKLTKFIELKDIKITALEHWERFDIEQPKKISFLGRALPSMGYFLSLFAILANAYIAYMALRITTQDEDNSSSSISFSILATIFRSAINFFIYVMSGASETLEDCGETLSNLHKIKNIKSSFVVENSNQPKWRNRASTGVLALTSIGAGASIVTNVSINTIILFQEGLGLTERYLQLYPNLTSTERELYFKLIKWIVVVAGTLAGNYCELAFEANFAVKLIERLKTRFSGKLLHSTNPYKLEFSLAKVREQANNTENEQSHLITKIDYDIKSLSDEEVETTSQRLDML